MENQKIQKSNLTKTDSFSRKYLHSDSNVLIFINNFLGDNKVYHPTHPIFLIGQANFFSITNIILIFIAVFLLAISAFFASSETAFTSLNSLRLRSYAEERKKGARRALFISENFERTLTTILVANNLVNIASTTICAYLFAKAISNPTLSSLINTVVMTVIILIFGEILPKSLSKMQPEKFAMRLSGLLFFMIIILTPITWPFEQFQKFLKKRSRATNSPTVTEDELEDIIDTMEEEGVIESEDADIIQNVLRLKNATAYDVMTPRVDMICASIDDSIEKIKKLFAEHQFSRMPIYSGTRDNIVGVLNQKDIFASMINGEEIDIHKLITKPIFVSENYKVDEIIRDIQHTKKHLCVVLDEHGGTSGIVTMEDCIEEMVGEIYDEFDEEDPSLKTFTVTEPNRYTVNASMSLVGLFDELEIENVPKSNYSTVAGFLFELSEELPKVGDQIKFSTIDEQLDDSGNFIEKAIDMLFTVTKVTGRRIREVDLVITEKK